MHHQCMIRCASHWRPCTNARIRLKTNHESCSTKRRRQKVMLKKRCRCELSHRSLPADHLEASTDLPLPSHSVSVVQSAGSKESGRIAHNDITRGRQAYHRLQWVSYASNAPKIVSKLGGGTEHDPANDCEHSVAAEAHAVSSLCMRSSEASWARRVRART